MVINGISIIGWVMVVLGGACLVGGLRGILVGWNVRSWPTVIGKLERFEVIETRISKAGAENPNRRFTIDLQYSYEVNGRKLEGTKLRFGMRGNANDPKRVEEMKVQFLPGSDVAVYYDPRNPMRSALEVGSRWSLVLGPVIGLVFLAAGLRVLLKN